MIKVFKRVSFEFRSYRNMRARILLMERRGSGLKKILDNYQIQENYTEDLKPEFRSTQSSFYIILKNLNYGSDK